MHDLFDQRRYLIPFRSSLLPQIFAETLVIGAGVAGLRAAIAAAEGGGDVIVLCKDVPELSNTAWAQGGVAAALSGEDSFQSHIDDTLMAGAGLCDEPVVRRIVENGPERIKELIEWGLRVDRTPEGELSLGQEGAHSHHRIIHSDGDATGRELARCLLAKVQETPNIRLFSHCCAIDLMTPSEEPGAPVMGAITYHPRYRLQMIWVRTTILASGGAGVIFRETTNPRVATADGMAMAYRAGAALGDMSFMQFHPTTLYLAGANRALISEAVRGEGAYLLDQSGHRFMPLEHPLAELAPRDIVSRAIVRRIAAHGGTHVFLDVRHITNFRQRFPGISSVLAQYDLDPVHDLIPVNPAAHYTIGGVVTDPAGRTNVPGLLAAGEVTCTGLHGANRLASNSLLEGLVMGEAAGRAAREAGEAAGARAGGNGSTGRGAPPPPVPIVSDIRPSEHGDLDLADVRSSLRSAMWRNAGIERSGSRLDDVADMIDFWARYTLDKIFDDPEGWQTQNMLLAAALVARSAAWRQESRGCHWRSDYPEARDEFHVHDVWKRGSVTPTVRPVDVGGGGFAMKATVDNGQWTMDSRHAVRGRRSCQFVGLAILVCALPLLPACQTEEKIIRYNPFLANVPGAETETKPVGQRFKDYKDPTKIADGNKTVIENPDGTVKLIAKSVKHLMINIQLCIEHEDDEVLFDQVISDQTKQQFQSQGKDPHEAATFIKTNWSDISAMFGRMPFGEHSPNIIIQQPAKRTMMLELTGLAAKDMKFTELWAVMEKGDWKLLWVR